MSFQEIESNTYRNNNAYLPSKPNMESRYSTTSNNTSHTIRQLTDNLHQYQNNINLLQKLSGTLDFHSQNFDEIQSQFQSQLNVVNDISRRIQQQLMSQENEIENLSKAEASKRRVTFLKLKKDFDIASQQFEMVVESAALKFKQSHSNKKPQQKYDWAQESNNNRHHSDDIAFQVQLHEDTIQEDILREREEEIREIHKDIHKVNEIFRDLAQIVQTQQESVNEIDAMIEESHKHAKQGLDQVQKASEYQPGCILS